MSYFTAQAIARKFKENLSLSLPAVVIAESLDAAGFPAEKITVGAESCFLKIEVLDASGHVDGLGLAQRTYAPHKATFVFETLANVAQKQMLFVAFDFAAKLGMKLEVWEGTGVEAAADYDAAKLLAAKLFEIKADVIHGMLLSA